MHEVIHRLIEWHRNPAIGRPDVFAEGFTYTCQVGELDVEHWWRIVVNTATDDLEVIGLIADERSGAVFMEQTDAITNLRMRIAWWITGRDGKIASLLDVHTPIPRN